MKKENTMRLTDLRETERKEYKKYKKSNPLTEDKCREWTFNKLKNEDVDLGLLNCVYKVVTIRDKEEQFKVIYDIGKKMKIINTNNEKFMTVNVCFKRILQKACPYLLKYKIITIQKIEGYFWVNWHKKKNEWNKHLNTICWDEIYEYAKHIESFNVLNNI